MGVEDLQTFLTGTTVAGGTVPAELLRIARSTANKDTKSKKRDGQPSFSLVVDVECCLDRLYGGFFSGKQPIHRKGKDATVLSVASI